MRLYSRVVTAIALSCFISVLCHVSVAVAAGPPVDPVGKTNPPGAADGAESEEPESPGDAHPEPAAGFSQKWCDDCKASQRSVCRTECKDVQGAKYFVCVNDCGLRHCETACTPVEETPEETSRKNRKLCAQCKRNESAACTDSCKDRPRRERGTCKKACLSVNCKDSCAQAAAAKSGSEGAPDGEASELNDAE